MLIGSSFRFEGLLAPARCFRVHSVRPTGPRGSASALCVRAHSDDPPDLSAPSAALPTARTPPEPPFCRPPHTELQLLSSGASEPVDARFELAPLDDGQLERVEVARLQEPKIGHLPRKRGYQPPAAVAETDHAVLPSSIQTADVRPLRMWVS
jgi:hypothetical protein